MRKSFLVVLMLVVVGVAYSADGSIRLPRDYDSGVTLQSIDMVGTAYKVIDKSTTQTKVTAAPALIYGVVLSSAAKYGDYVTIYDSTTASTNGFVCDLFVDTVAVVNGRIIDINPPIQTGKGIYATNSSVNFISTIKYRTLR